MATIVGVFNNQDQAEKAVNEIRRAGITDDKISIVAKKDRINREDRGGDVEVGETGAEMSYADQDLTTGATTGGVLGGAAGLLAGAGALAIPGLGPIIAMGPIAAGLSGAATGGLAGSLVDLGIPRSRGEHYEEEVKKGGILAVVEADQSKINDVANYMRKNGARGVETH